MRGLRVGVVNPRSPFGSRIRSLLSEGSLPVIELKLFESEVEGEATLTQFQDDVVITQPLDPDLFTNLDVIFFAGGDSDLFNRLAVDASGDGILSIVEGAIGLDAPVIVRGAEGPTTSGDSGDRLFVVPRMASYLVGATLRRASDALSAVRASATILLPAGIEGDAGATELHQQVISLLSFKSPPTEVFKEQVAFNVKLAGSGVRSVALAESVAIETAKLANMEDALSVSLVQVPVFHGFAASIWVELEAPVEQRALLACFKTPPFALETGRNAKPPTPVGAAESSTIHIGGLRRPIELSQPGFWLWAVADTTAYDSGATAVEFAKARV